MRRANQHIVEPVAIDVADRSYGIAAHVANHASVYAAIDSYRSSWVSIGKPGLAEDDVSGALLAVIVWRGHHEIAEAVAIEVAGIRDGVAGLRTHRVPGIAYAEPHMEYGGGIDVVACRDGPRHGNVISPVAENHVGAVVRPPPVRVAEANARSTHDDVRKA